MIAVDDDPEGAQGNGRCVQEGTEAMGETPTEGWESKVGVSQQLQDRTNRGEHGEERLGGQFSLAGPGEQSTSQSIVYPAYLAHTYYVTCHSRNVLLTIASQPVVPCITIIEVTSSSRSLLKGETKLSHVIQI